MRGLKVQVPVAATLSAYVGLTKPRVMALLLVTTVMSMALAAGGVPPWSLVALTVVGGALGAGGASAINNYLDRDIDALMPRTASRPIPSGMVTPQAALRFGLVLLAGSLGVLGIGVNGLAALLTLAGALGYIFVYTRWLKRSSVQNIVIGGAAGAVPPLVGWAAVTGEVSLLAVLLFALIFLWTPPHFWALSLLLKEEYEAAHVPMLPVVGGEGETRRQILLYSVLLVALSIGVGLVAPLGAFYLVAALVLGRFFLYLAVRLFTDGGLQDARRLFRYSIPYLALLFAAMVVDRLYVLPQSIT